MQYAIITSKHRTFKIVRYVIRIIHDEMTDVICHKQGLKGLYIIYNDGF